MATTAASIPYVAPPLLEQIDGDLKRLASKLPTATKQGRLLALRQADELLDLRNALARDK